MVTIVSGCHRVDDFMDPENSYLELVALCPVHHIDDNYN